MKYTITWQDQNGNTGSFNNIEADSDDDAVNKVKSFISSDTLIEYEAHKEDK